MYEGLYFSAAVEAMKGLDSLGAAAAACGAVAPSPKVALVEDKSGHSLNSIELKIQIQRSGLKVFFNTQLRFASGHFPGTFVPSMRQITIFLLL